VAVTAATSSPLVVGTDDTSETSKAVKVKGAKVAMNRYRAVVVSGAELTLNAKAFQVMNGGPGAKG
jgi:ABC-type uncharacterized transport system permease subunit